MLVRPETAIFAMYAAVTCFMTYPAVTMWSRTYAERRDPLGSLWSLWWCKYSFIHNLPVSPMSLVAVPWGKNLGGYATDPLSSLSARAAATILNETVAYNLILLFSFFLSAIAMYFLVRSLAGSRPAATFSGLAFGFCPYMLAHGKEHLGLAATFWLPLFALVLLTAWRRRSTWSIVGCGVLLVTVSLFNNQYGMLAAVFGATFLVTAWLGGKPWKRRSINWSLLLRIAVVFVLVAVVAFVSLAVLTRSSSGKAKPLTSLYQYSARPWDYFLPSAESAIFGTLTGGFINSHLHGSFLAENSLFLGYTVLALAIYALLATFREHKSRPGSRIPVAVTTVSVADAPGTRRVSDDPYAGRTILAFAVCAVVAFIFSMPPTSNVLGIKFYFPAHLMYKVLPQFRAYTRFGIIVMMCTVVLAGYGIAYLANWLGGGKRILPVAALLLALVVMEFTIVPPFYSLDTEAATGYSRWLKSRPGKPVAAIYPLYAADDFQTYDYFFQQRLHQKKLVNGADASGEGELYRQSLLDLYHPATPTLLKKLGARFVVVIPSQMASPSPPHLNYTFPTRFDPSRLPPGLKEVGRPAGSIIYEVTAAPAEFVPLFGAGSYQAYIDPEGRFWHPATNGVVVDIQSSLKQPALCDIKLTVMSARSVSKVTFEVDRLMLTEAEVPPWPVEVLLRDVILAPGANTLVVKSNGKQANLTEVPGYSDVSAAMMLSNILVEKKQ